MMKKAILLLSITLCSCASVSSASALSPSLSSQSAPFSSRVDSSQSAVDEVKVIVEEGKHFRPEQEVYRIPRGEELSLRLWFEANYSCKGVDVEGAVITAFEGGLVEVHLPPVYYSTRVHVEEMLISRDLLFHLNGGEFNEGTGESFRLPVDDSHIRPVLPAGVDAIKRDGYALIGWNTSEEGNGMEVGLGSRFGLEEGEIPPEFYAHWVKESPAGDFRFSLIDKAIRIDSYKGPAHASTVVLPAKIGEYPVVEIAQNAFFEVKIDTLVLPLSLAKVQRGAFFRAEIGEMYFYDNLMGIADECFLESSILSPHILIHEPVRGRRYNGNTQFCENLDRFHSGKGKKKIIYFSGCSGCYSFDSARIEEAFEGYYPIDLGILGDTSAIGMWESILPLLGEGDILIHAPEEMSCYSLLNDISCSAPFFQLFNGCFDFLTAVKPLSLPGFFDAFHDYVAIQEEEGRGSYADRCKYFDEYGDWSEVRPNSPADADFGVEGAFVHEYLDQTTLSRLNHYYDAVREKRAIPVFSYAPVNANAVARLDAQRNSRTRFDNVIRAELDIDVISDIALAELPGQYFYNADYHVTDEGKQERTTRLIADLKAFLAR